MKKTLFLFASLLSALSSHSQTMAPRVPSAAGVVNPAITPAARAARAPAADRAPEGPTGAPEATDPDRQPDPSTIENRRDAEPDAPTTDRSTSPGVKRDSNPSFNGSYK